MGCTERLVYRVCMRTLPEIQTGECIVQRDWCTVSRRILLVTWTDDESCLNGH